MVEQDVMFKIVEFQRDINYEPLGFLGNVGSGGGFIRPRVARYDVGVGVVVIDVGNDKWDALSCNWLSHLKTSSYSSVCRKIMSGLYLHINMPTPPWDSLLRRGELEQLLVNPQNSPYLTIETYEYYLYMCLHAWICVCHWMCIYV